MLRYERISVSKDLKRSAGAGASRAQEKLQEHINFHPNTSGKVPLCGCVPVALQEFSDHKKAHRAKACCKGIGALVSLLFTSILKKRASL